MDVTPSDLRAAPAAPSHLVLGENNPESLSQNVALSQNQNTDAGLDTPHERELLPRETGHDIGAASPVPLSAETVGIITRLRNMKVKVSHRNDVRCSNINGCTGRGRGLGSLA